MSDSRQHAHEPGRIQTSMTDLVVPLAGMPIRIERQYDSLERATAGDFGFGWRLNYNVGFQVDELHNVTMTMNGVRKTFAFTPVPNAIFQSFYAPVYTAPAGLYGKLESTSDTCNGLLVRPASGGWGCGLGLPGQTFQINAWKYTDPAGRAYTWSRAAGLQSIEDLNGNKLTFSPSGITSNSGNLSVPFERDSFGRITRITDPLGKQYQYGYGGARGS
ncbi:MAG: RHS repeat protein [Bryobacterales bacterium]|nr:RHS repeat protein [Bryobacterales bacterium]